MRIKGKTKKELGKNKCLNYGEMGHYSSRCPLKTADDEKQRKGKQVISVATSAEMDNLSKRLEEEDFAMISHFSEGNIKEDGWYVDSGATKHMTGS